MATGRALPWLLVALLAAPGLAGGGAPERDGRPYAEAALCAREDVILCEDFDHPEHFEAALSAPGAYRTVWRNPGLASGTFEVVRGVEGRRISPAARFPAKPGPAGGFVWVANWDPGRGPTGNASTWGLLRRPGRGYANGLPPATDVHIRFQYYVTPDYAWPGDPKTDRYAFGVPWPVIDNKILYLFPPEGWERPTGAAYDAGLLTLPVYEPRTGARFSDTLVVRYGDTGDSFKYFPQCQQCKLHPRHDGYTFQSLALRNPGDAPAFGKLFRFDAGRWYTLELRYKLSSERNVRDGVVEVWVDGSKVYAADDLATCGNGEGDCSGIGAINLVAYHNGADTTRWRGQQVLDNLVVATRYIGPPASTPSRP